MRVERDQSGIAAALSRTVDGLGKLVGEHLALARLELVEDARAVGGDLGRALIFAPLVVVGWGLACAAAAVVLAPYLGLAGSLLLVGGLNLLGGVVGIGRALERMRARRVMDDTLDEVERSAVALTHPAEPKSMRMAHER